MKIHLLPALKDNFISILSNERNEAVIIDPGEVSVVIEFIQKARFTVVAILLTHHHWDHVNGVAELKAQTQAPVWCSLYDRQRLPFADCSFAERNKFLDEDVIAISLPGHTLGQVGIYWPDLQALFSGDTLFSMGCGRLFEGTAEQMFASLQKIKSLPPETKIYFGHEYALNNLSFVKTHVAKSDLDPDFATYEDTLRKTIQSGGHCSPGILRDEVKFNPFLRASTVEAFRELRSLRDNWRIA